MFPDFRGALLRDGPIFIIAVALMYFLRSPLTDNGLLPEDSNPLIENLTPWLFGLCAVVALFALYFIVEAMFVTPYRLSKEDAADRPDRSGPEPFRHKAASYKIWDKIDPLDLYQAACLWVEVSPPDAPDVELTGDASAGLYTLTRAIEDNELPVLLDHLSSQQRLSLQLMAISKGRQPVTKEMRVRRADLRAFAEKLGVRPKFLYAEDR